MNRVVNNVSRNKAFLVIWGGLIGLLILHYDVSKPFLHTF